ncbi:MAG: ribosomal RNA small subunit methyltransferase A [Candidatus Staskawiczbacteria bacterium RIFCSPHIGHO2_02_FULL_34_10]|uniref:Ribosomal RNA small subunit methyltransferase A n=1 Tax=Candidatus Staskawiczbacteria bacterium RIFCSPHIGHO2_02_FULL_34_10 TaxID=1802205 RepID=A0A1G2HZ61_9BACT|nr:MAG: ribosomal RNA small subunit methyltransferase A [Candidatus Staskawiczbacteria bacterium RIFCSPHIGHO2_02_FULL_34_10]
MDLTSIKIIKELLLKHSTKPSKIMGQNFLVDKLILDKIIKSADLSISDTVLEIGPGIGTLTYALAKKSKKVIAIEKDRFMVDILKETLKDVENVEVIQGNALKFDLKNYNLATTNYKVVANIPYYLTSPLIRKLLESDNPPTEIILMVQKEVAQRICANPPNMSLLAVSVQFYAKAEIVSYVSKKCFWPSPKVDSVIIKITPQKNAGINAESREKKATTDLFFNIVKAGFSQPRKQLLNNFSKALALSGVEGLKIDRAKIDVWLLKNNINPKQRAETLSITDWKNLTKSY